MLKAQAEALVGQKVSAWTSMNGEYVGVLTAVGGRPWRGTVEITSVLRPAAVEFSRGDRQRRGFRPGESIEVGGSSIRQGVGEGVSYLEALRESLRILKTARTNLGEVTKIIAYRERQIADEQSGAASSVEV